MLVCFMSVCVCVRKSERELEGVQSYIYILRTAPLELFTRVEIRESVVPVLT